MSRTSSELVRAGAGAGKTTYLINKVVELTKTHEKETGVLPSLVITTFTRKATEEIRERLIKKACELNDKKLLKHFSSPQKIHISTIHGVLSLFLKRYGMALGIDPQFKIVGPADIEDLEKNLLKEVLIENPQFKNLLAQFGFSSLLNLVREIALVQTQFGEARSLTRDELECLAKKSLKALAQEGRELSERILTETQAKAWIEWATWLGQVSVKLEIKCESSIESSITYILQELEGKRKPPFTKKNPPVSEECDEAVSANHKKLKGLSDNVWHMPTWDEIIRVQSELNGLAQIWGAQLLNLKKKNAKLTMNDLELFSLSALRQYPDLGEHFALDWNFWLIDEYQDTSPLQVELLKHLVGPAAHYVVGDPQQSIYLFRGARAEVFIQKEKVMRDESQSIQVLDTNYRSRPDLLEFFNDLFTKLDSSFMRMKPNPYSAASEKPVAVFAIANGEDASLAQNHENQLILSRIYEILNAGAKPESICLLGRTHKSLNELAQFLEMHSLPVQLHAPTGFYSRREILDALCLFKFLINPHDNINLVALLRSPYYRVEDKVLAKVLAQSKYSHWNELQQQVKDHPTILRLEKRLTEARLNNLVREFEAAIAEDGFVDASHFHDNTGLRESNLWKLLDQLKSQERAPGFNPLNFIHQTEKELLTDSDGESDAVAALEPNRIQLMTVHASKGLQFHHVFLTQMHKKGRLTTHQDFNVNEETGIWSAPIPLVEGQTREKTLFDIEVVRELSMRERAEAKRVLYVALTRAIESVFLSWQEPIEERSWAETIPADFKAQMFSSEHYSYRVDREVRVTDLEKTLARVKEVDVRPPWQSTQRQAMRISVTEILERLPKNKILVATKPKKETDWKNDIRNPIERGILLHRLLESLKYQSIEQVQKMASLWFQGEEDQVEQMLTFISQIQTPNLLTLVREGHAEWGFLSKESDSIIEGAIDLWGFQDGLIWVVDYKSGMSLNLEKAYAQLEIYALALRNLGLKEKMKLVVIELLSEQVHVRDASDSEKVRAQLHQSLVAIASEQEIS